MTALSFMDLALQAAETAAKAGEVPIGCVIVRGGEVIATAGNRTIRDNEKAAQAIGVNILRYKIIAMVISAVLASVVGTAYVRYLTFADPYLLVSPVITIEIVLFATVGGLGRAYGPALGALLLVPLGEILRGKLGTTLPGLHYFIYGLVVIAVILITPRGLLPLFERWWGRWRKA